MFFDEKNLEFTNLVGILAAFRTKVEIKIPLTQLMFVAINAVVEYENFVDHEILRIFTMYEDANNNELSIHGLENALNKLGRF